MTERELPAWVVKLEDEDLMLIKRLVLASGSLKELAAQYGVSYPTIRARLDELIERVRGYDSHAGDDPLEARIRSLVANGDIEPKVAKELLKFYRRSKRSE